MNSKKALGALSELEAHLEKGQALATELSQDGIGVGQVASTLDQCKNIVASWRISFEKNADAGEEEAPKEKSAGPTPGSARAQLLAMTRDELLGIAQEKELELKSNANKAAIANAILLASGYSVTPEEAAEGNQ